MLASVAIGGAAIQTLHAQSRPPVYMVAINEINDQEGYTKQYLPTAQKTIKEHGGAYVARNQERRLMVLSQRVASSSYDGKVWRHSTDGGIHRNMKPSEKLGKVSPIQRRRCRWRQTIASSTIQRPPQFAASVIQIGRAM